MGDVILSNGVVVPPIGFGPGIMSRGANAIFNDNHISIARWNLPLRGYKKLVRHFREMQARSRYIKSVANGIRAGFKLLDYSAAYGAGENIVDAVELAGLHRKDVFLTGRISNSAQFGGVDSVWKQIYNILKQYRTDYVDLLMFHWPVSGYYEETWRVICEAYDKGLARSIGVANCHEHHLNALMKCGLKPMVNQFEVHPLFTQKGLVKYNQDNNIVVEAYTAIARFDNRLMLLPKLKQIANTYNKTPVQVVLRWHIQNGCIPIVRSLNMNRQRENINVFDFELTREEMSIIDSFNINSRLRYDPDNCDFTIL